MNKVLIMLSLILFTGCSTVSTLLKLKSASYDGTEYEKATHLLATINLSTQCTTDFIKDIHSQSVELYLYSAATPANGDIAKIEENLNTVITELVNHSQPVNEIYCKDKLDILNRMSDNIQHRIGSKPR